MQVKSGIDLTPRDSSVHPYQNNLLALRLIVLINAGSANASKKPSAAAPLT